MLSYVFSSGAGTATLRGSSGNEYQELQSETLKHVPTATQARYAAYEEEEDVLVHEHRMQECEVLEDGDSRGQDDDENIDNVENSTMCVEEAAGDAQDAPTSSDDEDRLSECAGEAFHSNVGNIVEQEKGLHLQNAQGSEQKAADASMSGRQGAQTPVSALCNAATANSKGVAKGDSAYTTRGGRVWREVTVGQVAHAATPQKAFVGVSAGASIRGVKMSGGRNQPVRLGALSSAAVCRPPSQRVHTAISSLDSQHSVHPGQAHGMESVARQSLGKRRATRQGDEVSETVVGHSVWGAGVQRPVRRGNVAGVGQEYTGVEVVGGGRGVVALDRLFQDCDAFLRHRNLSSTATSVAAAAVAAAQEQQKTLAAAELLRAADAAKSSVMRQEFDGLKKQLSASQSLTGMLWMTMRFADSLKGASVSDAILPTPALPHTSTSTSPPHSLTATTPTSTTPLHLSSDPAGAESKANKSVAQKVAARAMPKMAERAMPRVSGRAMPKVVDGSDHTHDSRSETSQDDVGHDSSRGLSHISESSVQEEMAEMEEETDTVVKTRDANTQAMPVLCRQEMPAAAKIRDNIAAQAADGNESDKHLAASDEKSLEESSDESSDEQEKARVTSERDDEASAARQTRADLTDDNNHDDDEKNDDDDNGYEAERMARIQRNREAMENLGLVQKPPPPPPPQKVDATKRRGTRAESIGSEDSTASEYESEWEQGEGAEESSQWETEQTEKSEEEGEMRKYETTGEVRNDEKRRGEERRGDERRREERRGDERRHGGARARQPRHDSHARGVGEHTERPLLKVPLFEPGKSYDGKGGGAENAVKFRVRALKGHPRHVDPQVTSMLRCGAVCCSVVQYVVVSYRWCNSVLQCVVAAGESESWHVQRRKSK